MRIEQGERNVLDVSALVGVVVGLGLLIPAAMSPDLRELAFLAYGLLVPSLLYGLR